MSNRIEGGNLIIDTPTTVFPDGTKQVSYYYMADQWPQLENGATIYIDGDKLGETVKLQFRNGPVGQNPWHIERCFFKNIGKVVTGSFANHGLRYMGLSGRDQANPGLAEWAPTRKYATGHFGFHVKQPQTVGHAFDVSVLDGGTIDMDCIEGQGGFSIARLSGEKADITVERISISNYYFHDTDRGELFYIGNTTANARLPKLKNLTVKNGFGARGAAEGGQWLNVSGGTDISNLVFYGCATNWMNPFGAAQDNGLQLSVTSGVNNLSYVIVDGSGAQMFNPFGSEQDPEGSKTGVANITNLLLNGGRNSGMYLHNSAHYGVTWNYDNIYLRDFTDEYLDAGFNVKPYAISKQFGTDPVNFGRVIHNGSKARIFEGDFPAEIIQTNLPAPKYMNSGFREPATRIKMWHPVYGAKYPKKDQPTRWYSDSVAIHNRRFYKSLVDHYSDGTIPANSPNFLPLVWDINGVRNDEEGFESPFSYTPPDDLRLTHNCYWKQRGFGVQGIEQSETILREYYWKGKRYTVTDKHTYSA